MAPKAPDLSTWVGMPKIVQNTTAFLDWMIKVESFWSSSKDNGCCGDSRLRTWTDSLGAVPGQPAPLVINKNASHHREGDEGKEN